jgi:isopentenyl phosphate kinase
MSPATMSSVQFLKLGGSLITEKAKPHTPRMDVISRLAREIASIHTTKPGQALVLGHGSGSFGHVPARRWSTRQGVRSPEQWLGFAEVWKEADELNRLVMNAITDAGIPALSFSALSAVTAYDGKIVDWDLAPIRNALGSGLVPVVHGDVVFDSARGGTILSTEDLFKHLAKFLHPYKILLAGIEPGVWADFPVCSQLISEITPASFQRYAGTVSGSAVTDVTGGMASKVQESLELIESNPNLQVIIFSGEEPGLLGQVLSGEVYGTLLRADFVN